MKKSRRTLKNPISWIGLCLAILISGCAGTTTTISAPEKMKGYEIGRIAKEMTVDVYVNRNDALVLGKGTIQRGAPIGVTDVEVK